MSQVVVLSGQDLVLKSLSAPANFWHFLYRAQTRVPWRTDSTLCMNQCVVRIEFTIFTCRTAAKSWLWTRQVRVPKRENCVSESPNYSSSEASASQAQRCVRAKVWLNGPGGVYKLSSVRLNCWRCRTGLNQYFCTVREISSESLGTRLRRNFLPLCVMQISITIVPGPYFETAIFSPRYYSKVFSQYLFIFICIVRPFQVSTPATGFPEM
jgi:hypothetical protein